MKAVEVDSSYQPEEGGQRRWRGGLVGWRWGTVKILEVVAEAVLLSL